MAGIILAAGKHPVPGFPLRGGLAAGQGWPALPEAETSGRPRMASPTYGKGAGLTAEFAAAIFAALALKFFKGGAFFFLRLGGEAAADGVGDLEMVIVDDAGEGRKTAGHLLLGEESVFEREFDIGADLTIV